MPLSIADLVLYKSYIIIYYYYSNTMYTKGFNQQLYSCDKSSYNRSVYSQFHVYSLKYTDQNINNQTLTQIWQLYVHISFCLDVVSSLVVMVMWFAWVICVPSASLYISFESLGVANWGNLWTFVNSSNWEFVSLLAF